MESGSEWEAVLAARREAGMIPAPPAATPQARPEEVRDGSNSPAADPVALLLRDLRPETPAPVPPEEPAPAPVDPPAEEEGPADFALLPWAVHVSSFRTFTKAEEDEAVWTGRGENVLIEEAKIPEKGTWFRVLVGNFADRAAAEAHAAKVKERFGLDYVQVRRHPGF